MILSAFKRLKQEHQELVLLIAPRHLSRVSEIEELISEFGLTFIKKSTKRKDKRFEVILLDTMGELENLYSISEVAFVGGSLVPTGGHNILEPAYFSKPIIFGEFMFNFEDIRSIFLESKACIEVKDKKGLLDSLTNLIKDESLRLSLGRAARNILDGSKDAVEDNFQIVKKFLC